LYKPLPKQFRRDGFGYRQIAREGTLRFTSTLGTGVPIPLFTSTARKKAPQAGERNGAFTTAAGD
jgi:hypothetical protein